jgi:hypothetical protein
LPAGQQGSTSSPAAAQLLQELDHMAHSLSHAAATAAQLAEHQLGAAAGHVLGLLRGTVTNLTQHAQHAQAEAVSRLVHRAERMAAALRSVGTSAGAGSKAGGEQVAAGSKAAGGAATGPRAGGGASDSMQRGAAGCAKELLTGGTDVLGGFKGMAGSSGQRQAAPAGSQAGGAGSAVPGLGTASEEGMQCLAGGMGMDGCSAASAGGASGGGRQEAAGSDAEGGGSGAGVKAAGRNRSGRLTYAERMRVRLEDGQQLLTRV